MMSCIFSENKYASCILRLNPTPAHHIIERVSACSLADRQRRIGVARLLCLICMSVLKALNASLYKIFIFISQVMNHQGVSGPPPRLQSRGASDSCLKLDTRLCYLNLSRERCWSLSNHASNLLPARRWERDREWDPAVFTGRTADLPGSISSAPARCVVLRLDDTLKRPVPWSEKTQGVSTWIKDTADRNVVRSLGIYFTKSPACTLALVRLNWC